MAGPIAGRKDEDRDTAATRVWAAGECLEKAGAGADVPLVLGETTEGDWVLLASGPLTVATWVASAGDDGRKLAMAVLVRVRHASV